MKTINTRTSIIIGIVMMAISISSVAQDLRYTQALSNPLTLNPALMGINTDLKFILNYRSQWANLDDGYTTYSFTGLYPMYLKQESEQKLDIGVNVMQDKAGAFKTLNASIAIGYNLQITNRGYLNFSLTGGYVEKSLSTKDLTFDDQYVLGSFNAANPTNEIIPNKKVNYPDFGFGALWYYNPSKEEGGKINAYLGASAFHLTQPDESFTYTAANLPIRYSVQGGIKILGENKIDVTPNIIYNLQNGNENSAAGLLLDYHLGELSKISLGAWVRKDDAIAFSIGFDSRTFGFAYSYDVATSQISNAISGLNANEVTLALKFNRSEKKGMKAKPSFF